MKLAWCPPLIPGSIQWKPLGSPQLIAQHNSDAEYSSVVVFGGYRKDGTMIPARDFFSDAIAQTDFLHAFKNASIFDAFMTINEELHLNIKRSIQDEKWDWDRQTVRNNGSVVKSPRNIFDNGDLLRSQNWEIK